MSTAILDRPQGRSDEGTPSVFTPVRPEAPVRRQAVSRPATRPSPVTPPAQRSAVGCAAVVGGRTVERGYRMGRWARLAVTLSVLASALILMFGGQPNVAGGSVEVVTTPGQTVWSVARDAVGPNASPAAVGDLVDRIRAGNALDGTGADAALPTGLVLQIPTG